MTTKSVKIGYTVCNWT